MSVVINGTNIMSNPILTMSGFAVVKGQHIELEKRTPVVSVTGFIKAFNELLDPATDESK
jgi:hypothetical protein